jgi:hypothetical protein
MAWERRGTKGRTYYYHSRRVGGRVVKEYVGSGWVGALAEAQVQHSRRQRADAAAERAVWQRDLAETDRALAELDRACHRLAEAALVAHGYHRHCGHWRRRRHGRQRTGSGS